MSEQRLSPDQKGQASLTLKTVIEQTRNNFPDPKYRPQAYLETSQYFLGGIDPSPYQVWPTADGIGTKPELAERLFFDYGENRFSGLAFDTFAMIESDEARWGRFLLGIANIIDMNTANPGVISSLAKGAKEACDQGKFALLNGETAELGYRVSGYGSTRVNWNAVGLSLVVPEKLILGKELRPNQPIVAFREKGIRSNGLTRARKIMELCYISGMGCENFEEYFMWRLNEEMEDEDLDVELDKDQAIGILKSLSNIAGHDIKEQIIVPWHSLDFDLTGQLLRPSTLYGPVIYEAQGGVRGEKLVNITAAAHISGGGIPEKAKRMVEQKQFGAHIESVFPEPEAIQGLLKHAEGLPEDLTKGLIDDKIACEQWNRGIGFIAVTETLEHADRLIYLASTMNYEAAIAGTILNDKRIEFRGHTWNY
jgi:phosphoribosylaminoimidazole (AIR) synthetase